MKFKISIAIFIVKTIAVIPFTQAGPREVIYTGNTCDCPKKFNYLVYAPSSTPPPYNDYKAAEYGYKLDVPVEAKAKVTYSFDFTVLEPKTSPPPFQQPKLNPFAKADKITAHKKDCYTPTAESHSSNCGCSSSAANSYVSPQSSTTRYTRNTFKYPNSIHNYVEPVAPTIMAIFYEPLPQTKYGVYKARNKRDISRIFMRPRKNEKRSERVVKQYNKRLTDQVSNAKLFEETRKPIRSRSVLSSSPAAIRPLQYQFNNLINLPYRLRNRRDIKGEYDLIEKEHKEMDLTLPEIIQYMPETLDPNFKRGPCQFGQRCKNLKSSTEPSTSTSDSDTTTTSNMNDIKDNTQETTKDLESNINDNANVQEIENDNDNDDISSTHTKRNAAVYGKACPRVFSYNNPTPDPSYTYEPLTNYQNVVTSSDTTNMPPYGFLDPVPQLYVGAPYNSYSSADHNKSPLVGLAYDSPNVKFLTNAQLDQVIAGIVNKHADFIDAKSHNGWRLVDPVKEQVYQNKLFLQQLFRGNLYSSLDEEQQLRLHTNVPYYQAPLIYNNPLPPLSPY